jgi:RNA polymerase sigma-70 factor (ECF subfamily)
VTGDAQAVRRIATGDAAAVEQLYLRHSAALARFCVRIAGNPDDAADLVQETFARFIRQSRKLDPETVRLPSYLFATAQNLQARSWRAAARTVPLETTAEPVAEALDQDPARALLLAEQRADVRRASEALNDRQRSALALREVEDLSYDEIGTVLGINRNAVAQLLFRSRLRLRGALRRGQIDEELLSPEVRAALPALCAYADGELAATEREAIAALLARSAEARDVLEALLDAGRSYRGLVFLPVPLLGAAALAGVRPAAITAGGLLTVLRTSSRARNATIVGATAVAITGVAVAGVRLRAVDRPARQVRAPVTVVRSTPPSTTTVPIAQAPPPATSQPAATTAPHPRPRVKPRPVAVVLHPAPAVDATNAPPAARLVLGSLSVSGHVLVVSVTNAGGATSRRAAVTLVTTHGGTLHATLLPLAPGTDGTATTTYPCAGQRSDRVVVHLAGETTTANVALDCPALAARLVIDAVTADGPTLRVTVRNAGGTPAQPSQLTASADGIDLLTASVGVLAPGASVTVGLDWPCVHDTGEITIHTRDDTAVAKLRFACP